MLKNFISCQDQKYIRLMVEHKEDERQARMTRLVENLTGHNGRNPDYQVSCHGNMKRVRGDLMIFLRFPEF